MGKMNDDSLSLALQLYGTLPKRPKLILTITMIPSLIWLIVHTNLRVKILVICNHYLARKQQSVGRAATATKYDGNVMNEMGKWGSCHDAICTLPVCYFFLLAVN